jgi:hypothetical protein
MDKFPQAWVLQGGLPKSEYLRVVAKKGTWQKLPIHWSSPVRNVARPQKSKLTPVMERDWQEHSNPIVYESRDWDEPCRQLSSKGKQTLEGHWQNI